MTYYGHHDGCGPCDQCGAHLDDTDRWPCLACGRMLCGSCDCSDQHPEQDD